MSRPPVFISTIVEPASSYNLVDFATVKTLFNLTDATYDAFLNLLIPQASGAAQTFCHNPFVVETIQDQFYPGSDGWPWTVKSRVAPLQLSRWPLVSIVSVVETVAGVATTLTQGTDFLVDAKTGQLTRLNTYSPFSNTPPLPCFWRANPVTINYEAGYNPIPPDVIDAVATIIKGKFYARSRDPMIRSQNSQGVLEQAYWFATGPGGEGDLPIDAQAKLQRYRVPVFG